MDAVAQHKMSYTRYADDLTFSASRAWNLRDAKKIVSRVVRELASPKLELNEHKTVFATTKYRRSVTGLILANDGRVTLGRDRKRKISAAVHAASDGRLSKDQLIGLAGMLAFVNGTEPEFLAALRRRYSSQWIDRIFAFAGSGLEEER